MTTETETVKDTRTKTGKRRVVFELAVATDTHISPRAEDHGAEFRRFVVEVSAPSDKRLLIISTFNGLVDPNFRSLVVELKSGLNDVLAAEAEAIAKAGTKATSKRNSTEATEIEAGSTTDTSSETEPSR